MISSDYSSDGDEVEDESLVMQPSKKLPVIIFRPEVIMNKSKKFRSIGEKYNLRFKFQRGGTGLIRNILSGFGFRECAETSLDYNVLWMNSHVKPFSLRNMLEFQKVNHFPRSFELTRKDRLARNVERMAQTKSMKLFDFIPRSFMMPSEYQDFCQAAVRDKGPWIVKPIASSRGRGIYLVNNPNQVPLDDSTMVCKYLGNPLLVDGFKFDIRLYVAVTSYDPLIIYLYEEGMARFATIKYDSNTRHIKNQWMHLTNYSINKKNQDYVKSEDPDQEDFGNKWTLGALLRYLREEGIDTKTLMAKIEQVIIKSIIAVESPIAQATKMFVPYRGNCCELYGFDILIDSDLKPWVLEVNLSPSLATDAPLDMKIKANCISDFFNLMGIDAVDPFQSRKLDAKTHSAMNQKSRNKNNSNASSNQHQSTEKCAPGLSPDDARLIKWIKDQHSRRGGFVRIFPRPETWSLYGGLLEFKTHTNELLAQRLFPETYRAGSALVRSRTLEDRVVNQNVTSRFNQYERKLLPVDSKERKRERKRIRRKNKRKSKSRKVREEITSDLDDDEAEDGQEDVENIEQKIESKIQTEKMQNIDENNRAIPEYIEKSEIYKSIHSSKRTRNEELGQGDSHSLDLIHPEKDTKLDITIEEKIKTTPSEALEDRVSCEDKPRLPDHNTVQVSAEHGNTHPKNIKEIVSVIRKRARDLCQIEAREAFATYLLRVQQRFMIEANSTNSGRGRAERNDQIELVCRFLTRASGNLEKPLELNLPDPVSTSLTERKRIIGNLLIEFTQRYNKETKSLISQGQNVSSGVAPREKFEFFLKFCSEQEVEDILTIYTQENKSASVFLGAKKPKNKTTDSNKGKTHEEIVKNATAKVKEEFNSATNTSEPKRLENRIRSVSQDRSQKLLNRPTNTIQSPFEQSVRGAAYIYTTKIHGSRHAPRRPLHINPTELDNPIEPAEPDKKLDDNQRKVENRLGHPRPPSTIATSIPTTANEAIKLALKKLAERTTQDSDSQRVSQLAQQLAKLNQTTMRNSSNRPSSATVHRNTKYTSKYRNTIKTEGNTTAAVVQSSTSRTGLRDSSLDRAPFGSNEAKARVRTRPKSAHPTYASHHTRVCWK